MKLETSIQQYDSDGEIKADFDVAKAGDYSPETFPLKIQALHSYAKNAPTAVRNDIDQPFNMGLDDFLGAMSNAEVSKYSTPGLGSLSRTGIGGANQVARVSLSDLFQPQTVIGQALKREYIDMKNQVDGDFTYEDYVELSQNLASYSYDSFKEALAKGGVAFALTTAVTSIPVIGPIISLSMMGYGAVDGIYGYAFGKELLTGRELSEEEKILKGLLGVLYVGMLSMTAYNGLVNLKKQRAANKKAEKVVGPEKPNELSQRDKVLKNIEESKKARDSSNFSDYLIKEKEILAKKVSGAGGTRNGADSPKNVGLHENYKGILGTTEKANPLVDSLRQTGQLPSNYLDHDAAKLAGWKHGKALENYVPGGQIGGSVYQNTNKVLPEFSGRIWREADVGLTGIMSRAKQPGTRLLYSSDGLLYITTDHYETVHFIGTYLK